MKWVSEVRGVDVAVRVCRDILGTGTAHEVLSRVEGMEDKAGELELLVWGVTEQLTHA